MPDRRVPLASRVRALNPSLMRQLTLVVGYGSKPRAFEALIADLQKQLGSQLGSAFRPYALSQVHSTIVGLEGIREADQILNVNFMRLRHERRAMALGRALAVLDGQALPLRIRIGGFAAARKYPFTSRGRHPYARSFSLQGSQAVVIGWPVSGTGFPLALDDLRRCFARDANVLHKYHGSVSDIDNDFFFVLGTIDESRVDQASRARIELDVRDRLANREPLIVAWEREHVSVVVYTDPLLPLSSSRAFRLDDALHRLEQLRELD